MFLSVIKPVWSSSNKWKALAISSSIDPAATSQHDGNPATPPLLILGAQWLDLDLVMIFSRSLRQAQSGVFSLSGRAKCKWAGLTDGEELGELDGAGALAVNLRHDSPHFLGNKRHVSPSSSPCGGGNNWECRVVLWTSFLISKPSARIAT